MDIRDIAIQYVNYTVANADIQNDLSTVHVPCPIPDDFEQKTLFCSGFDHSKERYMDPTWVTATPYELEESSTLEHVSNFIPRPDIVYRIKKDVASQAGLVSRWMVASDAPNQRTLPNGTKLTFPPGSKVVQCDYDTHLVIPVYKKPIGSL